MDGLQKLSLAFLPFAIALLSYAFIEMWHVLQDMDAIILRLEEYATFNAKLERETASADILKEISERSGQRLEILNDLHVKKQLTITEGYLAAWRSKIRFQRIELKQDQGALQQFSAETYTHFHKMATALANLLAQEDAMWVRLQQFLEKQSDNAAIPEEREQMFQHIVNDMLELMRYTHATIGTAKSAVEQFQSLKDDVSLESKRMIADSTGYKRSMLFYSILFLVSTLVIFILCCVVVGLRIRKREPSRLVLP
jgi:hypothetical protein